MDQLVAQRAATLALALRHLQSYLDESGFLRLAGDPDIDNFAFGDPHDLPLPDLVQALQRAVEPQDPSWFAYPFSRPEAQEVVAASLRATFGLPFEPDDIAMTNAGAAAITVAIQTVVDPGDEVLFNLPPWFGYESMTVNAGGIPVKVPVDRESFDLDLTAIEAAITPRTRAIIVNTPCNPTGKIYPPATLARLAKILDDASRRHGRPIYLISDEAYRRIVFEGHTFHTPLAYYPYAMMAYSYGKTLLAPGQRIGYLALAPTMPNREVVRRAIWTAQVVNGYLFPNSLMQRALAEIEPLSIDIPRMQAKRDRMVTALSELGYQVHSPEGTFYLLPRSPWDDDWAFIELLERHNILCLPGTVLEFPGFFRICLTATEAMIERSLSGFAAAIEHAHAHPPPATARAKQSDRPT